MPTYNQAIVLYRNDQSITQNPATISNGVYIDNTSGYYSGDGVFGTQDAYWDLFNYGTIHGPGNAGVYFEIGGNVTNNGGASIYGGLDGVYLGDKPPGLPFATYHDYGKGLITNEGTIEGKGRNGVYLTSGGQVDNNGPNALITGGLNGVYMSGNTGDVVNTGTITGVDGSGVFLAAGGVVQNLNADAVIYGGDDGVLMRGGGSDAVINAGTIAGAAADGVVLSAGGFVSNETGAKIADGLDGVYVAGFSGTVSNGGTILGANGSGIHMVAGGYVNNGSAGYISGADDGILFENQPGTVINSGGVGGFYAVHLTAGGIVTNTSAGYIHGGANGITVQNGSGSIFNAGTILGTRYDGVYLGAGGAFTNAANGYVSGGTNGVYVNNQPANVENYGAILATQSGGNGALITASGGITNESGALIEGYTQGIFLPGGGTVVNHGSVIQTGTAGAAIALNNAGETVINDGFVQGDSWGVWLVGGGNIDNAAGGYIGGGAGPGIINETSAATIVNTGTVTGNGVGAIWNLTGGSVTNTSQGYISGNGNGVTFSLTDQTATVVNGGQIAATGAGIYLGAGGFVENAPGAVISGGQQGVKIEGGPGTIVDAGTIAGGGTAIVFGGTGGNLLVLENGYSIVGAVSGSTASGASNTLELAGNAGAPLVVSYNGLAPSGFQDVAFGPGGYDRLLLTNDGGTLPITLSDFNQTSEFIDLTALGTPIGISPVVGNTVTVSGSEGTVVLRLDDTDATNLIALADGTGGTEVAVACFCRGTLIRTPDGEVPVEALAIGDPVLTAAGEAAPLKWIGRRAYDPRFVVDNRRILPIRIAAGALADGVPARDLRLSPEHAVYLDGVLLPARLLVNGMTITQETAIGPLEYFHLELEGHEVIWAEGAAVESYVDCDNRGMFHNAAEFAALYPDDARPAWTFCAPRAEADAPELVAVRAALLARAQWLGYGLTEDPDLHLIADGARLSREPAEDGVFRFRLTGGCRDVRIASRSVVPAELAAAGGDIRCLGVPLLGLALSDPRLSLAVAANHPALCDGFHDDEGAHRWTDGFARIPVEWLRLFPDGLILELRLAATGLRYPLAEGAIGPSAMVAGHPSEGAHEP